MIRECDATNRRIKEFKESILERETLGSTSVYTGLPYRTVIQEFVEQSELNSHDLG